VPVEPLVLPVEPVAPEFGLDGGVVEDVEPEEPGVVELDDEPMPLVLPLVPVPAPPIEDVEPGVLLVLPLAVVSLLLPVLPVVVLGDVLPLRLPDPLVDGVVLPVVVLLLEPVPLEPVVALSAPRLHADSEKAATMASATAVSFVFIRNSLNRL
jgi:hypothetical protein